MKTLTFTDFTFCAKHKIAGRSRAAGHVHGHRYTVRFWFKGSPDQDAMRQNLNSWYGRLEGQRLDFLFKDSSDEGLAAYFLGELKSNGCVRVRVTNGNRGAEVSL